MTVIAVSPDKKIGKHLTKKKMDRLELMSASNIHLETFTKMESIVENVVPKKEGRVAKKPKRIVINVSGTIFETFEKTLQRFPETLLGDTIKRLSFYKPISEEYYFNRNRQCFEAIFSFYQTFGQLRCPLDIKIDVFEHECRFFDLPDASIYAMKLKAGILPELQFAQEIPAAHSCRAHVWNFLEHPDSSYAARVFTLVSLTAILLSIVLAIFETVDVVKYALNDLIDNFWGVTELTLNSWFLLELIMRFSSAPIRKDFVRNWLNFIDSLAVGPYFIMMAITPDKVDSLGFLRILRLVRIFRLFKLSKHSKRLKIVGEIVSSSMGDFKLLVLSLCMLVVLSGSTMYYLEKSSNEDFASIPIALWWGVITVMTIGK